MNKAKRQREEDIFTCKNSDHVNAIALLKKVYKKIPEVVDILSETEDQVDYNDCFHQFALLIQDLDTGRISLMSRTRDIDGTSRSPYRETMNLFRIARSTITAVSRELDKPTQVTAETNTWVIEQLESAVVDIGKAKSALPPPTNQQEPFKGVREQISTQNEET